MRYGLLVDKYHRIKKNEFVEPNALLGYRMDKDRAQSVDGWEEIARGKYFCNKTLGTCNGINVMVTANQSVSTEINESSLQVKKVLFQTEFGFGVGESVGVSTAVQVPADPIPAGRTLLL